MDDENYENQIGGLNIFIIKNLWNLF